VNTSNRNENLRLYGCRQPRTAFDIYARCAISACTVGPGDESTAMDIREQAHRIWRDASRCDKVKWDELFENRHMDANVFKKGHGLLETQGLLAKLRPRYQMVAGPSTAKQSNNKPRTSNAVNPGDLVVRRGEDKSKS
jgi:hypothetical protein